MNTLITVVIPTYNRAEALTSLLADLAHQVPETPRFEVVVVNSSEAENVEGAVEAASGLGLSVSLLIVTNNIGVKRNSGADKARGELLVFVDDDMRVGPAFVRAHADLNHRPRTIYCGTVQFPPELLASGAYYRYKDGRHRASSPDGTELSANRIVTMNMSLLKRDFVSLGGFMPNFPRYGQEDLEFGYRAIRMGYLLRVSSKAHARHVEVQQNWTTYAKKLYCAAYHGNRPLLESAPEARHVRTMRYTETFPVGAKDSFVRFIIGKLASPRVIKVLLRAAHMSDRPKMPNVFPLYLALAMASARRGVLDRTLGFPDRQDEVFDV